MMTLEQLHESAVQINLTAAEAQHTMAQLASQLQDVVAQLKDQPATPSWPEELKRETIAVMSASVREMIASSAPNQKRMTKAAEVANEIADALHRVISSSYLNGSGAMSVAVESAAQDLGTRIALGSYLDHEERHKEIERAKKIAGLVIDETGIVTRVQEQKNALLLAAVVGDL